MDPNTELERLRSLDNAAIEAFYRKYAPDVLGWVIRLGGSRLDAEDVAHQVFEVALNRLTSFRGESSVRTWLYGITRRVVANARRRAAVWSFVTLEALFPASKEPDPEVSAGRAGERRAVQQALELLSEAQREVIVLIELEERPAPEVAEMLGIPVGTVYSRLHNARKAFAAALERKGITAESVLAVGGAR